MDRVAEYFKRIYGSDPLSKDKESLLNKLKEEYDDPLRPQGLEESDPDSKELSIEERLRRIQGRMKKDS